MSVVQYKKYFWLVDTIRSAQKDQPGGKKTMLAWYWMVEGQAYDQNNG